MQKFPALCALHVVGAGIGLLCYLISATRPRESKPIPAHPTHVQRTQGGIFFALDTIYPTIIISDRHQSTKKRVFVIFLFFINQRTTHGRICAICPVSSNTITEVDIVRVTAPAKAAAPVCGCEIN